MSATNSCDCLCPTPEISEVPGSPGEPGAAGADGSNGVSAFSTLTIASTIPPLVTNTLIYTVSTSVWMAIGQKIFVGDSDTTAGGKQATFQVVSLPSATSVELEWLQYPDDSAGGSALVAGVILSPTGPIPVFSPPANLTNNTTGTPGASLEAGVGQSTLSVFFRAAAITGNVLLFTYVPGFAFKILKISASVVDAITTGAKAATLTTAIGGTPTTGGIVIMSGAYALGAVQASSANVTALNTGTSASSITVTASAVTAFIEGGFMFEIELQNMDTANAVASLNASITSINATL